MVVMLLAGCSHVNQYMDFWSKVRETKTAFQKEPTANLLRELHLGGNFLLTGPANISSAYEGPVLVVAVTDMFKKQEILASRVLQTPLIYYQIYLPEGNYTLYFFSDLNGNGYFEGNEVIGQTSKESIHIRKEEVKDGLTFIGPSFTLDVNHPATTDLPIKVPVKQQDYIIASLDDALFDPQYGEIGLYDTKKFFAHTQRFMFSLEKFDPKKTTVVFVHGVSGTPRDFKYFVDGLDRKRYQPWFFFYPTGMPLQKLGSLLSKILEVSNQSSYFHTNRTIIVAHSMGGLVALAALNQLCRDGVPDYLKGYISLNSPYGGVVTAKKAIEKAPAVVESWRDVVPDSPFLERLYQGSAAKKAPFYLFFGYSTGDSSDGTITLQSQLNYQIQSAARKTYGFNASHVGMLNDGQVRRTFYELLDAMDGK